MIKSIEVLHITGLYTLNMKRNVHKLKSVTLRDYSLRLRKSVTEYFVSDLIKKNSYLFQKLSLPKMTLL